MGEATTRAKLASRGLGYSWGIAEDTGRAISWLEQRDLPGLELLACLCQRIEEHLEQAPAIGSIEGGFRPQTLSQHQWSARQGSTQQGFLCPILTGIALSDAGLPDAGATALSAQNVVYPLLLLPFAADLASTSGSFLKLTVGDYQVITEGDSIWFDSPPNPNQNPNTIPDPLLSVMENVVVSPTTIAKVSSLGRWLNHRQRASVPDDVWTVLDQFAGRTYAPATEESRLRGAGAGISDND